MYRMATRKSQQQPVLAVCERQGVASAIAREPGRAISATHWRYLAQRTEKMLQPGLAPQRMRNPIEKLIDRRSTWPRTLKRRDVAQASAHLRPLRIGARPESEIRLLV